jgi:flagellar basal-body rod protein FlgB
VAEEDQMSLLDAVERLRVGLDYHLQRHNVLVSNLAQAETPNYKPLDLARSSFDGELNVALSATSAGHIGVTAAAGASGSGGPAPEQFRVIEDTTAKAGADGNAVDIDREAVKISTNQMRYDMLAQLASAELSGLEWAANDGKSG